MENEIIMAKMKESSKKVVEAGVSEASLQVRKSRKYCWSVFNCSFTFFGGGFIGSLADV